MARRMTDAEFPIGRFSTVCLAAFFFIALVSLVSAQEKRYALVVGNGNYVDLPKLRNPANDATDMASALTSLGFTVKLLIDAGQATMNEFVVRLGNQLSTSSDSVGFFYYAGHGVQSADGQNYLIPTNAKIPAEAFLGQSALALQTVLEIIQSAHNQLNIVVLDACRNNPFSWSRSGTRGLAIIKSPPPGSIVSYAAAAGQEAQEGSGRNGIYTGELLKNLKTPGLEIDEIFKRTGAAVSADTNNAQTPAIYSLFYKNFYLAGGPNTDAQYETSVAVTSGSFSVVWEKPERNVGRIIVSSSSPKIPAWVAAQRLALSVSVDFTLQPDGAIAAVNLDQSSGYADVDSAVIDAVRRWRFTAVQGADSIKGVIRLKW